MTQKTFENSHRTRSLKVSFAAQIASVVAGLLRTFIFTIFIAPTNFGVVALAGSITGIIQLLKDFGYSTYIIQHKNIEEDQLVAINTRLLLLGFFAFVVCCLIAYPLALFYQQTTLLWIIPISGFQFIFSSVCTVAIAVLRRDYEFNRIARIEVFANVGSLIFGLFLLLFIRDYWVLIGSGISYLVFQILLVAKYGTWKYRLGHLRKIKLTRESAHFGRRVTFLNVFTFLAANIDNIIIGKLSGQFILGVYSKGFELGVTNVEKLKRPVQTVYYSDVSNKEAEQKCTLFLQYTVVMTSLLIAIVGPILVYNNMIILSVFGSKWALLTQMLPPFLLGSFLWVTMSFADQLTLNTRHLKTYSTIGAVKNIVGLLAVIIASFWGAIAIAWAYFLYHLILFVPFCYYCLRTGSDDHQVSRKVLKDVVFIIFLAILTTGLPWILSSREIFNPAICLVILCLLFLLIYQFYWKKIGHSEPLSLLKSFFKFKFRSISYE